MSLEGVGAKLGQVHRYTAWVLNKMASMLLEEEELEEALDLTDQSLHIQERVYDQKEGTLQVGQTLLDKGWFWLVAFLLYRCGTGVKFLGFTCRDSDCVFITEV